jgi:hypothetical protein
MQGNRKIPKEKAAAQLEGGERVQKATASTAVAERNGKLGRRSWGRKTGFRSRSGRGKKRERERVCEREREGGLEYVLISQVFQHTASA